MAEMVQRREVIDDIICRDEFCSGSVRGCVASVRYGDEFAGTADRRRRSGGLPVAVCELSELLQNQSPIPNPQSPIPNPQSLLLAEGRRFQLRKPVER